MLTRIYANTNFTLAEIQDLLRQCLTESQAVKPNHNLIKSNISDCLSAIGEDHPEAASKLIEAASARDKNQLQLAINDALFQLAHY